MDLDPAVDDFAHWHVASGDVDPVYPVLGCITGYLDLDAEDCLALVLLYVAYYNLSSALQAWLDGWRYGKPLTDAQLRYPTGTERRAHRDVRQFVKHMDSLNRCGLDWFSPGPDALTPVLRWRSIQRRLEAVHGNGRWAGYKTGEILDTVLEWNCPPPDAGHAHSSGPRKGLADLFPAAAEITGNDPASVLALDGLTDILVDRWAIPVAQVETVLCDWHSTVNGHYYVGHDIDQMLEQATRLASPPVLELIAAGRADSFDERWLGEASDWDGVRPALNRLYVDEHRIDWWN